MQSVSALATAAGIPVQVAGMYTNMGNAFHPTPGFIPEVSIVNGGPPSDAIITAYAKAIAEYGKPVLFRYEWEMNLAGKKLTAAASIAAWRHVFSIVRPIAPNALFYFCTTSSPGGDSYYPGDDVVDYIGSDAYDRHGQTLIGTIANAYAEQAHHNKPFLWGEFGTVNPTLFFSQSACSSARTTYPLFAGWSVFDATGGTGWVMSPGEIKLWQACNTVLQGEPAPSPWPTMPATP